MPGLGEPCAHAYVVRIEPNARLSVSSVVRSLLLVLFGVTVFVVAAAAPGEPRSHRAGKPGVTQAAAPQVAVASVTRPTGPTAQDLATKEAAEKAGDAEEFADEPLEEVERPDPVARGPGELAIFLFDAATGGAVASKVSLYRIDAPATKHWGRGDQLQATRKVGVCGAALTDLPLGRYRIYCHAERREAPDPPAFVVGPRRAVVEHRLQLPARGESHLRVFDEGGVELTTGTLLIRVEYYGSYKPDWRVTRPPLGDHLYGYGVGCGRRGRRPRAVRAGPRGFALGGWREPSKSLSSKRRATWSAPDRCDVEVVATGPAYVATAPLLRTAVGFVRLPDGTEAWRAGATIWADVRATPPDAPGLPVELSLRLKGYTRFSGRYEIGSRPPLQFLRRLEARQASRRH